MPVYNTLGFISGEESVIISTVRPSMRNPFTMYLYQTPPRYGDWNDRDGRIICSARCDKVEEIRTKYTLNDIPGLNIPIQDEYTNKSPKGYCRVSRWQIAVWVNNGIRLYAWHISDIKELKPYKNIQDFRKIQKDGLLIPFDRITGPFMYVG